MTKRTWRTWPVLAVVLILVIGACTDGGSSETAGIDFDRATAETSAATEAPATAIATDEEYATDGALLVEPELAVSGTGGVEPAMFAVTDLGRDIIFVADIIVAVNDVTAATNAATREIAGLGGFVFGQSTSGAPNPTTVLTFKVFPEDFQEALRRLGDLGELRSQNISADDVTERVVDLESRINSAEASVERLRGLLDGAGDLATIAQLENQLLERETTLETLRGQLRTVQDQVALATIVVTFTEALSQPAVQLSLSAYGGEGDAGQSCPGDGGSLTVDEGTSATVCFEVTNVGGTPLIAIEVNDAVLGITTDDLIVVFGSRDEVMQPGDSIMFATELVVEADMRPRPRVAATPVDSDGQPIPGKTATDATSYFIEAVDPGGVATFGEGLEASLDFLKQIGRVFILGLGVALPFVWIVPIAWLVWRWRRRREAETETVDPANLLSNV